MDLGAGHDSGLTAQGLELNPKPCLVFQGLITMGLRAFASLGVVSHGSCGTSVLSGEEIKMSAK